MQKFVNFCLRAKTKGGKRLTLFSCICSSCHYKLTKAFETSRTDTLGEGKKPKQSCSVPQCKDPAVSNITGSRDSLKNILNINRDKEVATVPVCKPHHNVLRNSLNGSIRCFFCGLLLRFSGRSEKIIPGKNPKQKLLEQYNSNNLNLLEFPDKFVENENLEMHKKCWDKMRASIKRAEIQQNQSDVDVPGPSGGDAAGGDVPGGSGGAERLYPDLFDDDNSLFDIESEPETSGGRPNQTKDKKELLSEADAITLEHVHREIKKYTFITRKEVQSFFNNTLKSLSFSNGDTEAHTIPDLDPQQVQNRLQFQWLVLYPHLEPLDFTKATNRGGYLVHFRNVNVFQYVAKIAKERIEEVNFEVNTGSQKQFDNF